MTTAAMRSDTAAMLDRPVWTALASEHREFAEGTGFARRLRADLGPFAAPVDDGVRSMEDLARLLYASQTGATTIQVGAIALPDQVTLAGAELGFQMIAERLVSPPGIPDVLRLSPQNAPEMFALAERTKPGPFSANTFLLGRFWGVFRAGKLAAMAGERLRQPGFTEISAVCVDPEHRGAGLSTQLVRTVAAAIQARGETPYLHTYVTNTAAIRVYERVGFRVRSIVNIAHLAPARDGVTDEPTAAPPRWAAYPRQPLPDATTLGVVRRRETPKLIPVTAAKRREKV